MDVSSSPQPTTRLSSFEPFTRLPAELRTLIWELSLPEPRLVTIKEHSTALTAAHWLHQRTNANKTNTPLPGNGIIRPLDLVHLYEHPSEPMTSIRSNSRIPSLLHVCKESRYLASMHYQLAFSTFAVDGTTFFNFERDTLCLPMDFDCAERQIQRRWLPSPWDVGCLADGVDVGRVKRLALVADYAKIRSGYRLSVLLLVAKCIGAFGRLEVLTFVVGEDRVGDSDEVMLYDPVDVDAACVRYVEYVNHPGEVFPVVDDIDFEELRGLMRGLVDVKGLYEGTEHGFKMPEKVEYKIYITRSARERAERCKKLARVAFAKFSQEQGKNDLRKELAAQVQGMRC